MRNFDDGDLLAMMRDLESDLVERKESYRGDVPNKVREAVCAFANDLPHQPNLVGVTVRVAT